MHAQRSCLHRTLDFSTIRIHLRGFHSLARSFEYFKVLQSTWDVLEVYFMVLDTDCDVLRATWTYFELLGRTSMYLRSTFPNFKYFRYSVVVQVQKSAPYAMFLLQVLENFRFFESTWQVLGKYQKRGFYSSSARDRRVTTLTNEQPEVWEAMRSHCALYNNAVIDFSHYSRQYRCDLKTSTLLWIMKVLERARVADE